LRVLGIDPGSRVTGWGVVEERGTALAHVASGTIVLTGRESLGARLAALHAECAGLFATWSPAVVVIERAFVARNVQSAFRLGEARGAVLAAVAAGGAAIAEYAPAEVKLATVGHGRAEKDAMVRGVAARLGLAARGLKPDAADALALALCHLARAPLLRSVATAMAAESRSRVRGPSKEQEKAGGRGSSQVQAAERGDPERVAAERKRAERVT
jgi:crossover junction endodeoxyribonuclease RuvC